MAVDASGGRRHHGHTARSTGRTVRRSKRRERSVASQRAVPVTLPRNSGCPPARCTPWVVAYGSCGRRRIPRGTRRRRARDPRRAASAGTTRRSTTTSETMPGSSPRTPTHRLRRPGLAGGGRRVASDGVRIAGWFIPAARSTTRRTDRRARARRQEQQERDADYAPALHEPRHRDRRPRNSGRSDDALPPGGCTNTGISAPCSTGWPRRSRCSRRCSSELQRGRRSRGG